MSTARDAGGRPMRRDRENEFDLADIGAEANPATHAVSIAGPWRRPKRADLAVAFVVANIYRTCPSHSARSEAPNVLHLPRGRPLERRAAGRGVRVEIGEYRGVARVPRRVFQRLLPERPPPSGASKRTISSEPGWRPSPRGSYAVAS
jgi:hypothetical protein